MSSNAVVSKKTKLTHQSWGTSRGHQYPPSLPLLPSEFDSWCSLANAVGMRKHRMGAAKRESEKRSCSLLLIRGSKNLPVVFKKSAWMGGRTSSGTRSGWRRSTRSRSECCLPPCKKTNATSVMEAPGFENTLILTYLMRRRRCRDSSGPRCCTNKVPRARSGLLLVVGDCVVLVEDGLRQGS